MKNASISSFVQAVYDESLNIIKASARCINAESELPPALFIVCDVAANGSGKDRRAIAYEVLSTLHSVYPEIDSDQFDSRADLYSEFVRGKKLRCPWFLGDQDVLENSVVFSKIAFALCDILLCPEAGEDYDYAPASIGDIFEEMFFAQSIAFPLARVFSALAQAIIDY